MGFFDSRSFPFDGDKTYKVTLPARASPRARSGHSRVYDNQSRSMLDTPQRYPRAGSQNYPSPAAEAGRRRLNDDLLRPEATRRRQARELDPDVPGKGWFTVLRLYSPLESFFNKSWRWSELELVN